MKNIITRMVTVLGVMAMLGGCEIRTYPADNKPFIVVSSKPTPQSGYIVYSDELYEFENPFGEYCYGERDYDLMGTCYSEYCYDLHANIGWYHWDTYCF